MLAGWRRLQRHHGDERRGPESPVELQLHGIRPQALMLISVLAARKTEPHTKRDRNRVLRRTAGIQPNDGRLNDGDTKLLRVVPCPCTQVGHLLAPQRSGQATSILAWEIVGGDRRGALRDGIVYADVSLTRGDHAVTGIQVCTKLISDKCAGLRFGARPKRIAPSNHEGRRKTRYLTCAEI